MLVHSGSLGFWEKFGGEGRAWGQVLSDRAISLFNSVLA
jgi:hypothetical protein